MPDTKTFMALFPDSYIQTFDDTGQGRGELITCRPLEQWRGKYSSIVEMNKRGAGVYFTPNPCKGGRSTENVTALHWLYVDIDGGQKDEQYRRVGSCPLPPTAVVESKNGLHVYYRIAGDCTQEQWQTAAEGLREYFGGDQAVSSTNEVLRVPGFFHMKDSKNPFLIRLDCFDSSLTYQVSEIIKSFAYSHPIEKFATSVGGAIEEIKKIPIQDVLRKLQVDVRNGYIFEDGKQTSAHVYKQRNCITRFSGKPGSGSTIDAVMVWGHKTLPEAIQWLKREWNITDPPPAPLPKDVGTKLKEPLTWGTPILDRRVSPIKRKHYILFVAGTGVGKTTFNFFLAKKNAMLGHGVLYLSLEMSAGEMVERYARNQAGITKEEWRDEGSIPPDKLHYMQQARDEIEAIKNLHFVGFSNEFPPSMDNITSVIEGAKPDLSIIDNLGFIQTGGEEYADQNQIARQLSNFAKGKSSPIILIHHFNKTGEKASTPSIADIRGNAKLFHDADTVLIASRPPYDPDMLAEEKAMFKVTQVKDRDFGTLESTIIYRRGGSFYDTFIQ